MNYTILIADDEPEIRTLLRLYLENENYQIIEAENGKQALELLKKEHVDLCLLDIMMPEMDGYHVLQELRKTSNIPVMILSAKDADSEKILGLNLGADDYLAKPFHTEELLARIRALGRRRGEIVRNAALNRLQILFDEIPDADTRTALKEHGFRWSPKNQAWQRQLTDNAVSAARAVLGIA